MPKLARLSLGSLLTAAIILSGSAAATAQAQRQPPPCISGPASIAPPELDQGAEQLPSLEHQLSGLVPAGQ